VDGWRAASGGAGDRRAGLRIVGSGEVPSFEAELGGPDGPDREDRGWLAFLAEASDLLAGTLPDEDLVAALAAQLVVPRIGTWCAVYLTRDQSFGEAGPQRLARVWHHDERRTVPLREWLDADPPPSAVSGGGGRGGGEEDDDCRTELPPVAVGGGVARALPLRCGATRHGTLLVGWSADEAASEPPFGAATGSLLEDLARRVAVALDSARRYTREVTRSRQLQRGLLPSATGGIPGIESRVVYEPAGEGTEVGGDFYDIFPVGGGLWGFALGDVCGSGPVAAALSGLARHAVRMLGRDGLGPAGVLERLNRVVLDEVGHGRFLSLLYGEVTPLPDGSADAILASAGHPPVLRLDIQGKVSEVTEPQLLLGIQDSERYRFDSVRLAPGEALLCVTDGVTERRHGPRALDDEDGLARLLAECAGLTASGIAERVRRAVLDFAPEPASDDVAVLVLRAKPGPGDDHWGG
jgi:serine phosphatase RsbU (regulator of sigma subunit)